MPHRRLAVAFAACSLALAAPAEAARFSPVAQVRHNNGARLSLNGEQLPFASDYFPVQVGDTITTSRGFTDFSLQIPDPEAVQWQVQVFPGDSLAVFALEDYFITRETPFSDLTSLPSGDGLVIAYGFDADQPSPVVLTPVASQSVPEPLGLVGLVGAMAVAAALSSR